MTAGRRLACGLVVVLLAGVCGQGVATAAAPVTLNWYTAPQKGGSFQQAAKACGDASGGRYRISIQPLPADATQQREQLVRRLAARDGTIDLIAMDVIWTAEFGEAGWVKPWPRAQAAQISQGVIPAVLQTGQYRGRMYAAPLDATMQLLWFRKDLVPNPPQTWDDMIRVAESLPAGQNSIQVQAAKYEGFTVWFNSLLASAGGSILDSRNGVALPSGPTEAALRVMKNVATAKGADPSISVNQEDQGRLAFQNGTSAFMVNYTFVYPAYQQEAPNIFRNLGIALWPRVNPDEPAHVSLGGFNIGVGSYGSHKSLAFEAGRCLVSADHQLQYAIKDGLPPVTESLYQDPRFRDAYPYADLLLEAISTGTTRPENPAYNDISLAVQDTLHPPASINVSSDVQQLRSTVNDALKSEGIL
jgi:multiple sugar transport system substrate-binding protein